MKFSIRFSDQIVGTLVIVALAILIFAVFMLGTSQRWFKKDLEYKTFFTSAQGLSTNMAIKFKGFTIGNVKKISLAKDDRVEVIFVIHEEYTKKVTEGSLVEVQVSPIGLGNNFVFHPGRGTVQIPEKSEIYEINSVEGKKLINKKLSAKAETTDSIAAIMGQVQTLLANINESLGQAPDGEATALTKIITNVEKATAEISGIIDSLSGRINPILYDIETITNQAKSPSGTVMSILDGQGSLNSSLNSSLSAVADTIENLRKTVEFFPTQLPQLAVLISQLNVTLTEVQKVITSVSNNPLLKGGVPESRESSLGGSSPRDMGF